MSHYCCIYLKSPPVNSLKPRRRHGYGAVERDEMSPYDAFAVLSEVQNSQKTNIYLERYAWPFFLFSFLAGGG